MLAPYLSSHLRRLPFCRRKMPLRGQATALLHTDRTHDKSSVFLWNRQQSGRFITVRTARRLGRKLFPFVDRGNDFNPPSFDKPGCLSIVRLTGIHILRKTFSGTCNTPEDNPRALLQYRSKAYRLAAKRAGGELHPVFFQYGPHAYL